MPEELSNILDIDPWEVLNRTNMYELPTIQDTEHSLHGEKTIIGTLLNFGYKYYVLIVICNYGLRMITLLTNIFFIADPRLNQQVLGLSQTKHLIGLKLSTFTTSIASQIEKCFNFYFCRSLLH